MEEDNYLFEEGCCINSCNGYGEDGCWCDEVKCHHCVWYESDEEDTEFDGYKNGSCIFPNYIFIMEFERLRQKRDKSFMVQTYIKEDKYKEMEGDERYEVGDLFHDLIIECDVDY